MSLYFQNFFNKNIASILKKLDTNIVKDKKITSY